MTFLVLISRFEAVWLDAIGKLVVPSLTTSPATWLLLLDFDPDRYADARSRKNYSGMSPITKASGTKRIVLARYARNRRLGDALLLQAYSAQRSSPGARAYYDQHRARGATHYQALRVVANRLVGILHGCLRHHTRYDEHRAWHTADQELITAA